MIEIRKATNLEYNYFSPLSDRCWSSSAWSVHCMSCHDMKASARPSHPLTLSLPHPPTGHALHWYEKKRLTQSSDIILRVKLILLEFKDKWRWWRRVLHYYYIIVYYILQHKFWTIYHNILLLLSQRSHLFLRISLDPTIQMLSDKNTH